MNDLDYNVYIDEAGDEGFNFLSANGRGSSKFFVLAALIVEQSKDREFAKTVDNIKITLKYQQKDILTPLHFCKMSHEKKKASISKLLEFKDFKIVFVVFQKDKLLDSMKGKSVLYNYACKLLLQKITIFLKYKKAKANFIFEHRRNTHYDELNLYMKKVINYKKYVISLKPLTKQQSKCLQLADIVASSAFQAFEPNQYDGDVEPLYVLKLKDNIFTHNGKYIGYGIKIFPSENNIFENSTYAWIKQLVIHSA